MGRAALVIALGVALDVGCGAPIRSSELPPIEPANLIDGETYERRIAGLRATLARSGVVLDTAPVIETCGSHHAVRDRCARCELATRSDTSGIDPDLLDGVAIAFGRYPTSVIAASRLTSVALCRKIRIEGEPDLRPAGMAIGGQHRLFISLEYFAANPDDTHGFTIEQVVHHEVFHLLDDVEVPGAASSHRAWAALTPPGFAYHDPAPEAVAPPAGFVNSYATTNEREDRASLFEYLMGQPERLCELAQQDPIVAAKTTVIWERLAGIMGAKLLRMHAPCVDWIDDGKRKPTRRPPARRPAPRPKAKPSLFDRR